MDWTRDLPTWSHPSLSRRVACAPHRWHVQEVGEGPLILLLPGSGSSVHTWRDLMLSLAEDFHVVALDLPGQGFTQSPGGARSGLNEMAADIAGLVTDQGWSPTAIISHSAGTAIALRMAQLMPIPKVFGLNPALDNFKGVAGWLFPMLARLLALNPLTASLFTKSATPARSKSLITGTGSVLDDDGYGFYLRLMQDRAHVNGALNMMARWSLDDLLRDLPSIKTQAMFITGSKDKAVPPDVAVRASRLMAEANVECIDGLGHLAHEERPEAILERIRAFL
jgi:magnesium chelatase accessory protein